MIGEIALAAKIFAPIRAPTEISPSTANFAPQAMIIIVKKVEDNE